MTDGPLDARRLAAFKPQACCSSAGIPGLPTSIVSWADLTGAVISIGRNRCGPSELVWMPTFGSASQRPYYFDPGETAFGGREEEG